MNYYEIARQFDVLARVAALREFDEFRNRWINDGWRKVSEEFRVPSLVKTAVWAAVVSQQDYTLPLDFNGAELMLKYKNRRLDPVGEENLGLVYERRTGNMGQVRFYDWSGTAEEDLFTATVTITNNSKSVSSLATDIRLNDAYWVRFDPAQTGTEIGDSPGDWGYQIAAGTFVSGAGFSLQLPYRGPSGTYLMRVRPAETQLVRVYGIPTAAEDDAFLLRYPSIPRRLYNNYDVPELPPMGMAIAHMAVSVACDYHHMPDQSKVWWGRAMQDAQRLARRRRMSEALVTDLTIGSISGRQTGLDGVSIPNNFGLDF